MKADAILNTNKRDNYNPKNNIIQIDSHRSIFNNNNNNQNENIKNGENIKLRKIYADLKYSYDEKNNNKNKNINVEIINQRNIYCHNGIRTCQYTYLTFFPLALLNQFKTAFNWFF